MTRTELEHIIRAVAAITNENELIVIGSQAILAQYPDAPKKARYGAAECAIRMVGSLPKRLSARLPVVDETAVKLNRQRTRNHRT